MVIIQYSHNIIFFMGCLFFSFYYFGITALDWWFSQLKIEIFTVHEGWSFNLKLAFLFLWKKRWDFLKCISESNMFYSHIKFSFLSFYLCFYKLCFLLFLYIKSQNIQEKKTKRLNEFGVFFPAPQSNFFLQPIN